MTQLPLALEGDETMIARVRTRPIVVCLPGPSLSRMGAAIAALHARGAVFCGVNDIGVVERHTSAIEQNVDVWFSFSEAEFRRLAPVVGSYLARRESNLFVTFSTTLAHLDAPLALALAQNPAITRRILLADAMAARIFAWCPRRPINSLTGALSALTLLGARGPILLLGCDGVRSDQTAFDAYDQPEKLAPHRLGNMCTLHQDMQAFHENWPQLAASFERELNLPVPRILNCNVDSYYTVFPRVAWQDAVPAAASASDLPLAADAESHPHEFGPLDRRQRWPVSTAAAFSAALEAFRREASCEHEWIQREAFDPYLGWRTAPWPPHVVAIHPEAEPVDLATVSWSTLQSLRSQGRCVVASSIHALKVEIADHAVRGLTSDVADRDARISDLRAALDEAQESARGELEAERNAAAERITERDAAVDAAGMRAHEFSLALAHSRLARLAAEHRAHRLRVVLYPAGGHTSTLLSTSVLSEIPIVGIADSSPARWGTAFLGHPVSSPEALERLRPDVVVICSQSFEDEIYEELAWLRSRGTVTLRLYSPEPDAHWPEQRVWSRDNRVA